MPTFLIALLAIVAPYPVAGGVVFGVVLGLDLIRRGSRQSVGAV